MICDQHLIGMIIFAPHNIKATFKKYTSV